MAHGIVNKYKKTNEVNTENIKALGFSNALLSKAMSGSGFDLAHFQVIAKNFIKKLKKN